MNRILLLGSLALAATTLFPGANYSATAQEISKPSQRNSTGAKIAPQTAPDALVADLYKEHDKDRSPFFQIKSRALVDKYFEKSLADLIWKDSVSNSKGDGGLNADPLYDAQDTEIKNFSVNKPKYKDGKAEVTVSFNNFGEKQEIVYLLASDKSGWKITDIKYKGGEYTLSSMLKAK